MSLFIRVNTNFFSHRKTAKLRARIGNDALWVVPRIWAYAADHNPDGNLEGYEAEELAVLIGYSGDAQALLQALLQAGFLTPSMRIHDWEEHQKYHVTHASFKERAKKAADARWKKEREEIESEKRGEEKASIATSNAPSIVPGGLPLGDPVRQPTSPQQELNQMAMDVLAHINTVGGSHYRFVESHLAPIRARIKEVHGDIEGVKKAIDRKGAEWLNTEKASNFNPATLMRPSNFARYYDERDKPVSTAKPDHRAIAASKQFPENIQAKDL